MATGIRWQTLLKIATVVGLIVAANFAADGMSRGLDLDIRPSNEDLVHKTIMGAAVVYTVLLAIPFVPGVEIGLALLGMFGPPIVFLVYLCTITGISVSFTVGRLLTEQGLIGFLSELHLDRFSAVLREVEPMTREQRLAYLVQKAPTRLVPTLLRHRHIALAIALNLPGNFLIGGGGGIALIAGVSRLYSVPAFVSTVAIAVAPVPIAVLWFGNGILSR